MVALAKSSLNFEILSMQKSGYYDQVIQVILTNNQFGIKEIRDLKEVRTFFFDQGIYSKIEKAILEKKIKTLLEKTEKEERTSEYLTLMTFKNQFDEPFALTIYDSDELWQDPELVQIYPL